MTPIKDLFTRGDDYEWTIRLTDPAGAALPLQSLAIQIVAKPPGADLPNDSDATYRHTATFAADGTLSGAVGIRVTGTGADRVITEFLTPADIVALAALYDAQPGLGAKTVVVWDMQVTDATGRRKTVASGEMQMTRDIGRST